MNKIKRFEAYVNSQGNLVMDELPEKIEAYLSKFPDDAKSWADATGEIRELCKEIRELYNELVLDVSENDEKALKPLNFKSFKSPSEWNTKAKEYIRKNYQKLNDRAKKEFLDNRWFG